MLVDGWPMRWCKSSSCLRACKAFDVHVVVRDDTLAGVASTVVVFDVEVVSLCAMEEMTGGVCHCWGKSGILFWPLSSSSGSGSSISSWSEIEASSIMILVR